VEFRVEGLGFRPCRYLECEGGSAAPEASLQFSSGLERARERGLGYSVERPWSHHARADFSVSEGDRVSNVISGANGLQRERDNERARERASARGREREKEGAGERAKEREREREREREKEHARARERESGTASSMTTAVIGTQPFDCCADFAQETLLARFRASLFVENLQGLGFHHIFRTRRSSARCWKGRGLLHGASNIFNLW
jgi:hypothetical protein